MNLVVLVLVLVGLVDPGCFGQDCRFGVFADGRPRRARARGGGTRGGPRRRARRHGPTRYPRTALRCPCPARTRRCDGSSAHYSPTRSPTRRRAGGLTSRPLAGPNSLLRIPAPASTRPKPTDLRSVPSRCRCRRSPFRTRLGAAARAGHEPRRTIEASGRPGQGATFTVRLPMLVAAGARSPGRPGWSWLPGQMLVAAWLSSHGGWPCVRACRRARSARPSCLPGAGPPGRRSWRRRRRRPATPAHGCRPQSPDRQDHPPEGARSRHFGLLVERDPRVAGQGGRSMLPVTSVRTQR